MNAASPFGAPLFKFAPGETPAAIPLQQSPFGATSTQSTGAPLTVADILPMLPPDIARAGALPMEQPVSVSPQVLNEALLGGQAALPIFEIYRVCPALFQTPISPQDPRMIPLPAAKLPYLIAATSQGKLAHASSSAASPFSTPPAPPMGPSGLAPELSQPTSASASGMMLPPRRQGPPPPLADVSNRDAAVPQLTLPGQPSQGAPAFPMSPFAAVGAQLNSEKHQASTQPFTSNAAPAIPSSSPFGQALATPASSPFGQAQATPASSPFGQAQATPASSPFGQAAPATPASSPFGQAPATPASSPFGQAPATPASSPFGQAPATPASSPFGQAAPATESTLGSLFGAKAIPTGQPAPDTAPARPTQPPAMQMSSAPSASAPLIRISLANLIKGYTAAELGFDPMVVPAWITTALQSAKIQELAALPVPVTELGLLIDGITDVGFRNVLNTARREFQLRIDPAELQSALSGSSAPQTLPNLASLGSPPVLAPAPSTAQPMMRIDPPASAASLQQTAPAFDPAVGFASTSVPGTNSPFLAPATAPTEAPSNSFNPPNTVTPAFGMVAPIASAPLSGFGMPATALQPLAPKTLDPFAQNPSATFQPQPQAPNFQPQAHAFQQHSPTPQPQFSFSPPLAEPEQPAGPASQHAFFQPQRPAQQQPEVQSGFLPPQSAFTAPVDRPQPVAPEPESHYPITETTVLPPERHQDTGQNHSGFSFMPPSHSMGEGFTSDQLLGRQPSLEQSWGEAAVAAATGPLDSFPASEHRAHPSPVIDVPQEATQERTFKSAFTPPRHEAAEFTAPPQAQTAARQPAVKAAPSARNTTTNSNLGVQMHDTDPDQILLRALLDTDSELTPQKVVEMACGLPGIAACVCIQGTQSISHIGAHKPQAREFQRQATDLAQHLRTLAPLIGIEGAETFTMNSGDRLMTFCFPEGSILGVLHDAEPTLGLRDKITLIARELSRMII
ncbi:MAG: hypothetical protein NTV80_08245 [Verrucomicrobia bacterium]|nr:hypothetical protein [Verrucomicrobiota bacterium]